MAHPTSQIAHPTSHTHRTSHIPHRKAGPRREEGAGDNTRGRSRVGGGAAGCSGRQRAQRLG
eukprot:3272197-Rhodomonas_salina.1